MATLLQLWEDRPDGTETMVAFYASVPGRKADSDAFLFVVRDRCIIDGDYTVSGFDVYGRPDRWGEGNNWELSGYFGPSFQFLALPVEEVETVQSHSGIDFESAYDSGLPFKRLSWDRWAVRLGERILFMDGDGELPHSWLIDGMRHADWEVLERRSDMARIDVRSYVAQPDDLGFHLVAVSYSGILAEGRSRDPERARAYAFRHLSEQLVARSVAERGWK